MSEKRMLTGVLIDPENNIAEVRTIEDTLDNLYEMLHCDLIDIVERDVDGRRMSFICDDEGALKNDPYPSALSPRNSQGYHVMLVGALFIVAPGTDDEGNNLSLNEDDQKYVLSRVRRIGAEETPDKPFHYFPALFGVSY